MNEPMRFIIADARYHSRVHIEKLLNSLGHFSVVPVSTFDDVAVLSMCGGKPFDGLIINSALLPGDLLRIFGVGRIKSTLVYEHLGQCPPPAQWRTPRLCLRVSAMPQRELLAQWFRQ